MNLEPLLSASWVIQVHAFGAMAAFFLGVIQLAAPKGTLPHKTLGAVWIVIMLVVAISSIFIRPSVYGYDLPITQWFSFIHLFTILTLWGVVQGVWLLTRGGAALKYHSRPFIGMFVGGLIIAGGLAFLPGRIMNRVVFGG
ncbi:MAG: DUF2306 domain-containing protein [Marinicaulis sp.]|nr:DUF2306 domain-containing protein [Marinicaulis sp.]NNE40945.1 DUF2306 domain-containing protein [Marinicaulis sp.]NNL88654.1 DUF2306 domain-containing protein [Marinicaulis sp.]